MPRKLSSPSNHGSRAETLYARKISPVNQKDFQYSPQNSSPTDMSKGAISRNLKRYRNLLGRATGDTTYDNRTLMANTKKWSAQEQLRSGGWTPPELTSLSKNYADAANYHFDKGSFDKANHYHALSQAAKQEATTAKRTATAAKNKADRAARVAATSERLAAKAAKTPARKSKSKK